VPDASAPVWRLRTRSLLLDRPILIGVVNVTPDSFSDGGLHTAPAAAIDHGLALAEAGADVVDVGGESTRPGSEGVPAQVERERVLPVITALAGEGLTVSVDTTKSEVAKAALDAGAEIVNDVSAGADTDMLALVARTEAAVVLMHMQGTPRTMQDDPRYRDVVVEVRDFLVDRASVAEKEGVDRSRIVIDPGIGFGKTVDHNLQLLRCLGELVVTGYPVLVGSSRKAFLGRLTGIVEAADRDQPTAASTALAIAAGAAAVRVHDVRSSRIAADIAWAVSRSRI